MEKKDGKIVATESELEILKSEEGKGFLKESGLFETIEKQIEVPAQLDEETVLGYIKGNQSLSDKLVNTERARFLSKKLGIDEKEASNLLGEDIVLKKDLEAIKAQAIDIALKQAVSNAEYPDLLLKVADKEKLAWEDGQIKGMDEVLTDLQTNYAKLFGEAGKKAPGTPPAPKGNKDPKKYTYEEYCSMSEKERRNLSEEEIQKYLNS